MGSYTWARVCGHNVPWEPPGVLAMESEEIVIFFKVCVLLCFVAVSAKAPAHKNEAQHKPQHTNMKPDLGPSTQR